MSFKPSDLVEHNSELLKLLTQNLPDMLWVKDVDGKYIYANKAICDGLLMAKDTLEPIGKDDVFFALRERESNKNNPDWHTFGELCFNSDKVVIEKNKAMKFEEFGNVKGKLTYLEVFKAPFYDNDGNILGTIGAGRDITELKKIQTDLEKSLKTLAKHKELLEYQENHDSLTHLPNRILFLDRLHQAVKIAKTDNTKIALLFIDLDNFKEINDSLGHDLGDKVLVEFSKRIKLKVKKIDTLSRLGGDEFCIILNDIKDIIDISDFILNCVEKIKAPFKIDEHTLYVNMSIGISVYPNDGTDANVLLKNADAAMYRAKENGRNQYSFYDEDMTKKAYERVMLETQLREAFENDEFIVHYQPKINAKTNKFVGMEALVRWNHPTKGLIYPNNFIPLAEISGMIIDIDRIVMKKSIIQFHKWSQNNLNHGKLSLNLAIKQMEDKSFMDFFKKQLKDKEYLYEKLEFEVTESQIMANPDEAIKTLEEMSKLGVSISIDDFGTGYSSLAYLKKLPISKLKIDKSFIDDLPYDFEDVAITKTIINLCENLNLDVIAEGVENQKQVDFLLANGCENIQGYFYSKAISADEMTQFLKKYNKT
ncbi:MAG: EAL domain-containing protein [Thiovulaceae bacterium]|nr:EAL domain-containing protein [Sulfurimonadaceae bacterium]